MTPPTLACGLHCPVTLSGQGTQSATLAPDIVMQAKHATRTGLSCSQPAWLCALQVACCGLQPRACRPQKNSSALVYQVASPEGHLELANGRFTRLSLLCCTSDRHHCQSSPIGTLLGTLLGCKIAPQEPSLINPTAWQLTSPGCCTTPWLEACSAACICMHALIANPEVRPVARLECFQWRLQRQVSTRLK